MKARIEITHPEWDEGNCVVAMRILYMDERFRFRPEVCGESNKFSSRAGFRILSKGMPEIECGNEVFLRGHHKSNDLEPSLFTFDSADDADQFVSELRKALSQWALDWEGWANPPIPTKSAVSPDMTEVDARGSLPIVIEV